MFGEMSDKKFAIIVIGVFAVIGYIIGTTLK